MLYNIQCIRFNSSGARQHYTAALHNKITKFLSAEIFRAASEIEWNAAKQNFILKQKRKNKIIEN